MEDVADVRLLEAFVLFVWIIWWEVEQIGDYFSVQSACAEGPKYHQNYTHETVFKTTYVCDKVKKAVKSSLDSYFVTV